MTNYSLFVIFKVSQVYFMQHIIDDEHDLLVGSFQYQVDIKVNRELFSEEITSVLKSHVHSDIETGKQRV